METIVNAVSAEEKPKRNSACKACSLSENAKTICMFGSGTTKTKGMILFGNPSKEDDSEGRMSRTVSYQYLDKAFEDEGINIDSLYRTYVTKCIIPEDYDGKPEATIKTCAPLYLEKEIKALNPTAILAMGELPFYFFHHKKGLTKHRGEVFNYDGIKVIPTFSPEYILSNPQYHDLFMSDIKKFIRIINNVDISPKINIITATDIDSFNEIMEELENNSDKVLTFDCETRGFKDFLPEYSKMWNLALTHGTMDELGMRVFSIPLEHPQSPFADDKGLLKYIVHRLAKLIFMSRVNNHNVIFDLRHFIRLAQRYGYIEKRIGSISFDTMVTSHQLNEELPLNLLNVAGSELGVDNWGKGIQHFGDDGKPPSDLWGEDGMSTYCARDVGYTHMVYKRQAARLSTRQNSARLLKSLILPGMEAILQMQLNGIWVDPARVAMQNKDLLNLEIEYRKEVLTYIPEDFREFADISNDHFLRNWLFSPEPDGLGLKPISFTEKTKQAKVDESTLKQLDHPAVEALMNLKKTTKLLQFFNQWQEYIDNNNRMYPYFNLTGTVTGRRSCDRPNLQQVPRDSRLRGCLGAPPGWKFIEVDYSMLEVRIAAWFANEEKLLQIFSEGGDAYRRIASLVMNIPVERVTKKERQEAKAIVLGFIYGMGWRGFSAYARDTFNVIFTDEQSKEFREAFFNAFPNLLSWHGKVKIYVERHKKIESPLGRNRNLIRVLSNDSYMRWKAKAQGINCVDFDTQILSKRGWLTYDQLSLDDLVLTKNKDSNKLEWQKVNHINIYPDYEGKIVEFKSRSFNAISTPEHRWLTTSKNSGKNTTRTTATLGKWGDHRIHRTGEYIFPEESIYDDNLVSLIGWILTDGHFKKQGKWNSSAITITQSNRANPEKVKIIDNLLNNLNIKHFKKTIEWSDCSVWTFYGDIGYYIKKIIPNKRLTLDFICSLTKNQAKLLLDSMMLGDGTSGRSFICGDQEQTDLFQILCTLLGIATTVSSKDNSMYERKLSDNMINIPKASVVNIVSLLKRDKAQIVEGQFSERIEKIGVWCPTVANSFWVARRNGSVFITGNSTVQGLGGDLNLNAMKELHKIMPLEEGLLVGDIHDAVLFQIREDVAEKWALKIVDIMENPEIFKTYGIKPPVKLVANVKIGQYWGEGTEYVVEDGKLVEKD